MFFVLSVITQSYKGKESKSSENKRWKADGCVLAETTKPRELNVKRSSVKAKKTFNNTAETPKHSGFGCSKYSGNEGKGNVKNRRHNRTSI